MAKDRIEVEILAKGVKEAQASIQKLTKDFDKLKTQGDKTNSGLSSNFIKIAAGALALGVAMKKGLALSKTFLNFQQGTEAMERQFGVSSKSIIKSLKEVSQGTISTADIVSSANRAMALNVTKDIGQMAELLAVARERAKSMGITTNQAFSDIVTGVGRASPLILDNLGIITKGWDKEAKAAGVAMDAQFILNKVLADGAVLLSKAGAGALTNAEKLQQVEASIKNLGLAVGRLISKFAAGLGPGLNSIIDKLTLFVSGGADLDEVTADLIESTENYSKALADLETQTGKTTTAQKNLLKANVAIAKLTFFEELEKFEKSFNKVTDSVERTEDKVRQFNNIRIKSFDDTGDFGFGKVKTAVELNERAIIKAGLAHKDTVKVITDVASATGELTIQTIKLTKARKFNSQLSRDLQKSDAESIVGRNEINKVLDKLIKKSKLFGIAIKDITGNQELQIALQRRARDIAAGVAIATDDTTDATEAGNEVTKKKIALTKAEIAELARLKKAQEDLKKAGLAGIFQESLSAVKSASSSFFDFQRNKRQADHDDAISKLEIERDAQLEALDKKREQLTESEEALAALDGEASEARTETLRGELATANEIGNEELAAEKQREIDRIALQKKANAERIALDKKLADDKVAIQKGIDAQIAAEKAKASAANKKAAINQGNIDSFAAFISTLAQSPGVFTAKAIQAGLSFGAAQLRVASIKETPTSQFEHGTDFSPAGTALVGEAGPEILNLPQGSRITPNNQINTETNDNRNITINVTTPDAIEFVNDLKETHGLEVFQ